LVSESLEGGESMYVPRIIDHEIQALLKAMGAVVLEGPKACGKTESARQAAASEVRLDVDLNARQAVAVDPSLILEGDTPRLIDEWQLAPEIWNHIRRTVDDRRAVGQFILTGSAVPVDDVTRHTGAGRMARLRLRPMTLFESGHSTGTISLSSLLDGEEARSEDPGIGVEELAQRIVMGGWPGLLDRPLEHALPSIRAYLDEVCRTDIQRVEGIAHDPGRVNQLIRSLARNVATTVGVATMAKDMQGGERPMDNDTAYRYYEALTRLMIVEDQPAWGPHLRSRARVRNSPKRHFVDPSLAAAALRIDPARLLGDLNLMGFLFESLVARDLRVFSQRLDAQLLHYRDSTELEIDAIVEGADGRWGAFEVKLGPGMVDEGAENLLRFAEKIDTTKCGPPSLLGVIVGMGYGYTRPDGIRVIPIGALGP
jgi:predicted AAA+ superfamily ATPase